MDVLAGPIMAGKSRWIAQQIAAAGEPRVVADLTLIWAALHGHRRDARGRWPLRLDDDSLLPLAFWTRLAVTRRARDFGLPGWITTSTGDRANLERLQGIAGGEVLVLLEGEDVIRERIRTSQGINRGEQCEQGIRRWFGRYSAPRRIGE